MKTYVLGALVVYALVTAGITLFSAESFMVIVRLIVGLAVLAIVVFMLMDGAIVWKNFWRRRRERKNSDEKKQ